jgi:DNA-binding response OmpR family regulator
MTSSNGLILLVDDEEKILKRLGRALRDEGHDVVEATTIRDAQQLLAQRAFDLMVVDNLMPGMTGMDFIRELANTVPAAERPQIVMMTAHGSTQIVREAFKLGVEDFLEKPFEVDDLIALARRSVKSLRLQTERQYLISERDADFNYYGIVGRSRAMEQVIDRAELVAQTKSTVPHHRRDRHRQGNGRPADSPSQRPARDAAHQGELRRDSRDAAGVGALWPRARRLHRRDDDQAREVCPGRRRARSFSTRSAH